MEPNNSTKTFEQIVARLRALEIAEPFDMIVAIANGGLLPAALLHERTRLEVNVLRINWRDLSNTPRGETPRLLREPDFEFAGKRLLLADDRIKTGTTIAFARQILSTAAHIRTFAINGRADYALFDEDCFPMPWRIPASPKL
ncbi:phosphoribosyltransferase [Opitutaceae bacterium TAV4]|nr:phosphoribosyltransferase [Opitutaceae bacterium TAV4]RRJ99056.1 phosphoribosyltransferase [Opitutaceae bacterium TAV3]